MNLNHIKYAGLMVVGDTAFRGPCPDEDAELVTIINQWKVDPVLYRIPVLHIPNEKKRRTKQDFAELKKQKMKGAFVPGASDLIAIGSPTLVIELKRQDHTQSELDKDQRDFMVKCKAAGAWAVVALGHEAALRFARNWARLNGI